MKLPQLFEEMLWVCARLRLLDECPGYITRKGNKVKVERPPTSIRLPENFEAYKQKMGDQLPQWVEKLKDQNIFYFKVRSLADLIEDLEVLQYLHGFLKRYDELITKSPEELEKLRLAAMPEIEQVTMGPNPDDDVAGNTADALGALTAGITGTSPAKEEAQDDADMALWD